MVDGEKETEESDFGKAGVEFSTGTAVDGEKDTEESDFQKNGFGKIIASDPVVYQLVRVEGDGRLVPATDDEIMEVEHLLEEDKSGLASDEATKYFDGCVSNEGLPSKTSDFEGRDLFIKNKYEKHFLFFLFFGLSCQTGKLVSHQAVVSGLSQSENTEVDSQELNARLEVQLLPLDWITCVYLEVMLQKVKQEERLRLSSESLNHSSKSMDVNHHTFDGCNETQACKHKLQPKNTTMEAAPSMALNGSQNVQLEGAETCSEPANEAVTSSSTVSGTCTSSMPDFSILKGEICLDNLSIRELQEAFRATFGRQTSVKDKLWLKRRITMGLTNSCDVPTTSFVIKDNKIVLKEVKEEPSKSQNSKTEAGSLPTDQVTDLTNNNFHNLPTSLTNQTGDQQVSGKRLRKPLSEDDEENLQMEQFANKRVRKPTRRYIEELSEFEMRECSARLLSSVKNSGNGQSSPKSQIRPVCDIGSHGTSFSTRQDSLGGFGIQVPYVSRVRRGRPRKNFVTLMPEDFGHCQFMVLLRHIVLYRILTLQWDFTNTGFGMETANLDRYGLLREDMNCFSLPCNAGFLLQKQHLLKKYHPGGIAPNLVKTALGIPALQQNSEGGSRVRKARAPPMHIPQPNFVDEREERDAETIYGDYEHDLGLEEFDAAGDNADGNANTEPASKCGVRRKHHRAWTLGEVLKLVEGVARYGAGRWSEIRRLAFASYSYRTSVDLKDKWRNLLRASLAQSPSDKGAKNSRKHTSVPIPTPILSRVRELAEMHSQTGTELGPSKIAGRGGRVVQEEGSGFL
ncbi:hypothetical protein COCNU_03G003850 [Cocos nucifera]|uniref:Uncharacterized protein n=1 Tax=Cocos nucifera TaxID=13894 RepID=A0A8K0I2N4_COCNU|nr:hypothetical protein COCNU_03G003850 [Cocos nucifera]